mmetsp:Transcript_98088/g.259057  ORF Transcript_98088/g.259057 Transcript_98088/m.259057 type:complete len:235 (+) Transcript_98088:680-1384(+)
MMPASKAAISSVSVLIPSLASAMEASSSAILRSKAFFESSVWSNSSSQYSFLLWSSNCSFLRISTISLHITMTLSKAPWVSAFFPLKARAIMSRAGLNFLSAFLCIERIMPKASARWDKAVTRSCTKLVPVLGNAFLKRSKASSSLRTLMVSAKATSSSARVFWRNSHSCVLVLHDDSSSALSFWFSMRAASVSDKSFFISTMDTPSSPICAVFSSMVFDSAAISFFLATISAS